MPRLEYFLVAESHSVDQDTNSLSIFHVLEDIGAIELPVVLPKLVAISSWIVSEEEADNDYRATLRVSGGGLADPIEFDIDMARGRRMRHRLFHAFEGAAFPSFGIASFELLLNGERHASHTLTISQAVDAPQQAERAAG